MRTVLEMFLSSVGPMSTNGSSMVPSRYWYIHLVMHMPPAGEWLCTRTARLMPEP